ncbi:hypothetical protein AMATHDRAFT_186475 [Amanita thiersii Skay4041]|uniref:ATP-dependent DNA helicase CHL1 n=1 Tax=Amanita thiersii Skay4041 TaxID=703135 RepID=A0A2A9NZ70_9AGAR|nr:hypothetical protein AMATHDRAFT_186475 [Amanita thiersii Skay4041]
MSLHLPTPDHFPAFPYDPPYTIQVDLMRHLYRAIEEKKVAIVESPTGTGKTLSLLCASMSWLADEKDRAKKGKLKAMLGEDTNSTTKDWVVEQSLERIRRDLESKEEEYEERLLEARKREVRLKKMAQARSVKRPKKAQELPSIAIVDDNDGIFLPDSEVCQHQEGEIYISPALRALMAKLDKTSGNTLEDEPTCTKIYYASRTHSQLTQVLPELKKLRQSLCNLHPQEPSSATSLGGSRKRQLDHEMDDLWKQSYPRSVSLGSRKQLCINDELRAVNRDLDERCREMLNDPEGKRCPYLPTLDNGETRMIEFRDQILASPKDIEDLAELGRIAGTCPYFGSRRAIPQAELVTLPYNLLLQRSARDALGIDLTGQVVIIDEAHNLISTILSLSTTCLSYYILTTSLQQLATYLSRFRTRLSGKHMVHLKRLLVFLDALKKYATEWQNSMMKKETCTEKSACKMEVLTISEFMEHLGRKASGINLLEIEKYLKTSKIARKISSYIEKQEEDASSCPTSYRKQKGEIPPLNVVEQFMLSLTGANDDGRITISLVGGSEKQVQLKYQQLNPSSNFMEVVEAARSVILAGGTMSPIPDIADQLFPNLAADRITTFSCGHIIPETSLKTLVVTKTPCGDPTDYKAGRLRDANVIDDLGRILLNLVCVVPAGMVIFFPSYNFLTIASAAWQKSGKLDKIAQKKQIFLEPHEGTDVEKVLIGYAAAVRNQPKESSSFHRNGAVLLAVVGAKLSEGLNFADELARAVVVIGLPFANLGSPELQERLKYVKRREEKRTDVTLRINNVKRDAAAELYENMCMNAVNQSIGRAIRHRGDWASLILLDQRYALDSIRNKLPKWIGNSVTVAGSFGQVMTELGGFYRNKGKR